MEKQQFKSSVLAMVENNNNFEHFLDKAISSGCLDIEGTNEENYISRKALIAAIFKTLSENWMPLTKEGKEEFKNISHFI